MQCRYLHGDTWWSTSRDHVYMDSSGYCTFGINHGRECTGNRSGKYQSDLNKYNNSISHSDLYGNTYIRELPGIYLHSYSNSKSCSSSRRTGIYDMQWRDLHGDTWRSTCRDHVYLDSSGYCTVGINHGRECTRIGTGEYQSDLNKHNNIISHGDLYGNTIVRQLWRFYLHGYSNSKPETCSKCTDINDMQCDSIYSITGQRSGWINTCRYYLYMGSACYRPVGINHGRECTGSGTGEYQSDLNKHNISISDSDLYCNTNIRWLPGIYLYSYGDSKSVTNTSHFRRNRPMSR
jgi:hypothetical protein